DLDGEREITLDWGDLTPKSVAFCETLTGPDLKAVNVFESPNRVVPQKLDPPQAGRTMTFKLPKASYTVAQLALGKGRVYSRSLARLWACYDTTPRDYVRVGLTLSLRPPAGKPIAHPQADGEYAIHARQRSV